MRLGRCVRAIGRMLRRARTRRRCGGAPSARPDAGSAGDQPADPRATRLAIFLRISRGVLYELVHIIENSMLSRYPWRGADTASRKVVLGPQRRHYVAPNIDETNGPHDC